MENLEPIREIKTEEETEFNADQVVKDYAEGLRQYFKEQKEKKTDIHMENINPDELSYEDLMIFDKFQKGTLTKPEFDDYRKRLKEYLDLREKQKGKNFNALKDSRSNFSAMILNKLIDLDVMRRFPEGPGVGQMK